MRAKKIICALLCAVMLLSVMPGCASAPKKKPVSKTGYTLDDVCSLAVNEGEVATREDAFLWNMVGILPVIGQVLGCTLLPEVPKNRLEYKPPQYVETYKRCFQDSARSRRFAQTMYYGGYIITLGLALGGLILYGLAVQ